MLYYRKGIYEQAESLLRQALEIRERVIGSDHPDTATSLNSWALLYFAQDKNEQV